jgi:hypothetical protein
LKERILDYGRFKASKYDDVGEAGAEDYLCPKLNPSKRYSILLLTPLNGKKRKKITKQLFVVVSLWHNSQQYSRQAD